jgi:Family of unknown function (DUF6256)
MMALARARLIGSTGWVVILTAFVAWEALGLLVGHGWPTLSHITREVTRWRVGRWLLLGAWLWLGWHLFIRGWRFFLRGPQTKVVEPSALGSGFRELLAEVLVLGTALVLVFVGLLWRGAEHAEPERRPRSVGFGGLLLRVLAVAASCYAVLVGFIVLYILVAGNDPSHLLRGAVGGGALLAFGVVVPGFLILSVLDAGIARLRRAHREPSG